MTLQSFQKHEWNFNMQLFYNPTINDTNSSFVFDKEESKHIIKVLRKKEGDILHVTNGSGLLFTTKIALASFWSIPRFKILAHLKWTYHGYLF